MNWIKGLSASYHTAVHMHIGQFVIDSLPVAFAATTKSGVYGQMFMIKFPTGEQAAAAKEAWDALPTSARTWTDQHGLAHILKVIPDRSFPVRVQGEVLGAL